MTESLNIPRPPNPWTQDAYNEWETEMLARWLLVGAADIVDTLMTVPIPRDNPLRMEAQVAFIEAVNVGLQQDSAEGAIIEAQSEFLRRTDAIEKELFGDE